MVNSRRERERYLDEDGDCTMCQAGEWPRGAVTCPVCDAEVPDEDEPDLALTQPTHSDRP